MVYIPFEFLMPMGITFHCDLWRSKFKAVMRQLLSKGDLLEAMSKISIGEYPISFFNIGQYWPGGKEG